MFSIEEDARRKDFHRDLESLKSNLIFIGQNIEGAKDMRREFLLSTISQNRICL